MKEKNSVTLSWIFQFLLWMQIVAAFFTPINIAKDYVVVPGAMNPNAYYVYVYVLAIASAVASVALLKGKLWGWYSLYTLTIYGILIVPSSPFHWIFICGGYLGYAILLYFLNTKQTLDFIAISPKESKRRIAPMLAIAIVMAVIYWLVYFLSAS